MECMELSLLRFKSAILNSGRSKSASRYRYRCHKWMIVHGLTLIANWVPYALCEPAWSRHLSFDQIYNDTDYAQLQPYIPRPFTRINSHSHRITSTSHRTEHHRGNELIELKNYEEYKNKKNIQKTKDGARNELLLVGFSHDPFRYSVPEDDYLKGVRDMTPNSIMNKGENRGKRGVLHLYNMMYCATGCEPLAYKGYGCYCGFLGSGRPTDGIDKCVYFVRQCLNWRLSHSFNIKGCCKLHDECYENIYCPFFTVYFQPYYWKCYRGEPLCALENQSTKHQFINGCAARLCDCDRRFAMCVKKYSCPKRRALCRSSPVRLLQNLLMFR